VMVKRPSACLMILIHCLACAQWDQHERGNGQHAEERSVHGRRGRSRREGESRGGGLSSACHGASCECNFVDGDDALFMVSLRA
jgi:hypothetical protein